jgi:hypothetical protein
LEVTAEPSLVTEDFKIDPGELQDRLGFSHHYNDEAVDYDLSYGMHSSSYSIHYQYLTDVSSYQADAVDEYQLSLVTL